MPRNCKGTVREVVKTGPVKGKTFTKGTTASTCSDCLRACCFDSESNNGIFPLPLVLGGYNLCSKCIFMLFAILHK